MGLDKEITELRSSKTVKKVSKKQGKLIVNKSTYKNSELLSGCICSMKEFNEIKKKFKFRNRLKSEVLESDKFIKKNINIKGEVKGIPQGTPISGLLANIYMMDFDLKINKIAKLQGSIYKRYSDDILIICPNDKQEIFTEKIIEGVEKLLLKINNDKTTVTTFPSSTPKKSISYLGLDYNGVKVSVRASTLSKYYTKIISYKNFRHCLKLIEPFKFLHVREYNNKMS